MRRKLTYGALKTLEALEKFQYLTVPQMARAGVSPSGSKRSIGERFLPQLKSRHKSLVEYETYGDGKAGEKVKKKHYMYALSKYGAKVVADWKRVSVEKIQYPKGGIQYVDDYHQRIALINFHIEFDKWHKARESGEYDFKQSFFKTSQGKGKEPISQTRYILSDREIEPDGILEFVSDGVRRIFAIEVHMGNKTKYIVNQLYGNMKAMKEGVIMRRYDHESPNFCISIFKNEKTMENVKDELLKLRSFENFKSLFVFNAIERMDKDFSEGWHFADGREVKLFKCD